MRGMAQRIVNAGMLVLLACSGGTDEGDGFDRVVGKFCGPNVHSEATFDGSGWDVTLYYNRADLVIVTDGQGVLREQERRSCATIHVQNLTDPGIQDEGDAIWWAGQLAGVNPIY